MGLAYCKFPLQLVTSSSSSSVSLQYATFLNKISPRRATYSMDFLTWKTKNNAHFLHSPVTTIVNSILLSGSFPLIWQQAEITLVNKVKNPKEFKDLRPISLLYHLSKIVKKVIIFHLNHDRPIFSHQFASTKSIGKTDALVKLTSGVTHDIDNKTTVAVKALLPDFSKGF